MTPIEYRQNLHIPKGNIFSENPPKISKFKILNPPKNDQSLRMYENIRVPAPPPPGTVSTLAIHTRISL